MLSSGHKAKHKRVSEQGKKHATNPKKRPLEFPRARMHRPTCIGQKHSSDAIKSLLISINQAHLMNWVTSSAM